MPKKRKPTYREINGTTRVGDFLRSLGKKETLKKVLDVGGSLITGRVGDAIHNILKDSNELTNDQRDFALKLLQSDVEENQEISNRWKYDMSSDSWLSKNVRPISLMFLTFSAIFLAYLDFFYTNLEVIDEWIELLKTLLITVYVAYFGGRSYEKTKKL
ncbi:MAG: hypothetical protein Wins2KO_04130 [Winogradskyella sp.]